MATNRICEIPGCGKPHLAQGYCNKHYHRWRKRGDPLHLIGTERGAARQFYEALFETETDECVIWPFSRDDCGYGEMSDPARPGKKIDVHRRVCARVHGPRPAPAVARHLCGKGHLGCVNPKHLVWGTMKENSEDSIRHGTTHRGEDKVRARFTNAQVRGIRELVERRYEKGLRVKDIAEMYGCDPRRITEIIKGRAYANIHADAKFMTRQETVMPDGTVHVIDPTMTPMVADVYQTLRWYFLANRCSPSVRKLGLLSRCSATSVRKAARLLETAGYVTTDNGKEYTMIPTDSNRTLSHS